MRLLVQTWLTLVVTWLICAALIVGGVMLLSAPRSSAHAAQTDATSAQEAPEAAREQMLSPGDAAQPGDAESEAPAEASKATDAQTGPNEAESITSWFQSLGLADLLEKNDWEQWLILLGAIFGGVVIGKLVSLFLERFRGTVAHSRFAVQARLITDAAGPVNLAFITIGTSIGLAQIELSDPLREFCGDVIKLLVYIAVFWYAFNIVSIFEVLMKRITARTKSDLDDRVVPLVRKTLRIFVVVVGFLLIAENVFGQDIGAWLAGLGIAGLAVSLAAQDSLKNIFGSITIFLDQPFKVGERINYSGYDGPVEEIGFRSTKIRTLTGHLVTVPNSNIVNDPVENIGRRPYIRRLMNVTITYDTPREKIEQAVQILKDILEEPGIAEPIHGSVGKDEYPPRVYFNDYNAASLNIMVLYWYFPPAYWEYIEHAERVNLRLFEEYEKAGIEFAFPTQTLYLAGDPNRPLFSPEERGRGG